MPEPTTANLVRLPHTGLRMPDASLTVTSYNSLDIGDGVAFTATLRRDGRVVGTVEDQGCGGETRFYSKRPAGDPKAVTEQELAAYAAQCRTEGGEPVTVEYLLDELVEEFKWVKKISGFERKGKALLRRMGYILDGSAPVGEPWVEGEAGWSMPAERLNLDWAAETLNKKMPPGEHSWWQVWRDNKWVDVTPRPAGTPTDLYC